MPKIPDDKLKAIVRAEERSAIAFQNSDISVQRQKALEYYQGEPFGNEVAERSQVILTDVRDTIEWVMPSLMKIFAGGEEVVRFDPTGPEDVAQAEQTTDYINHIVMQDNPGFVILYTWMKDALLQKNGITKTWWDEQETRTKETKSGLFADEMQILQGDKTIEILAATQRQIDLQGQAVPVWDVEYRQTVKQGRICIENVPPEEFLISRRARTIAKAGYLGHRTRKTVSELIEMGYDRKTIEGLPSEDDSPELSAEGSQRRARDDSAGIGTDEDSPDESTRPIWVTEHFIEIDYDGDGIAEKRKIVTAGAGSEILDNEEWDGEWTDVFQSISPILNPHRFYGLSLAELVMDLQLIRSTILRQFLDNLYLMNNNRMVVHDDDGSEVNLDDLLTNRPGGIVRTKGNGSVTPLAVSPIGGVVLPALEFTQTIAENRTGVTRYNQGMDSQTLNKTAHGIMQIMSAAQERIALIARIFAETGVKDMFSAVYRLTRKYQDAPRTIKLRNQWVPVDPRDWAAKMDLTINVGLGTGNKQEQQQNTGSLLQLQEKVHAAVPGMVSPKNVYNAVEEFTKSIGHKNAESFFTPPPDQPPGTPPPAPPPDPKVVQAQQQMQLDQQNAQQSAQLEQQKAQGQLQIMREKAAAEIQLQREEMQAKLQLQREEMIGKQQLAREELMIKAQHGAFVPQPKMQPAPEPPPDEPAPAMPGPMPMPDAGMMGAPA